MDRITHHVCPVCGHSNLKHHQECRDHLVSDEVFTIVVCNQCKLGITQNVPPPDHIGTYYKSEDYISHSDTKKGFVNSLYHRVRTIMLGRKHHLVESYNGRRSGSILDIGCGTGYFLAHMKNKGWTVHGTEVDSDARAIASEQLGQEISDSPGLFDLSADTYDVITMWHVLEHVYDLKDYLRQIGLVLKEGGVLVIAVPNYKSYDACVYQENWAAYDVPRHLWHFSPESVRQLAEPLGFEMQAKKRMPFDPFYISMMSEKYRGSRFAMVKGAFNGGLSFLRSLTDIDRGSSVIYVFRKQFA